MSISFPQFFFLGLMDAAGWPQKRGALSRKLMANAMVVDGAREQLAQLCMALGATAPSVATRVLADVMNEWTTPELREEGKIEEYLDEVAQWTATRQQAQPAMSPWAALVDPRMLDIGLGGRQPTDLRSIQNATQKLMPWSVCQDDKFQRMLHIEVMEALVWGLFHPEDAVSALNSSLTDATQGWGRAKRSGMRLEGDPQTAAEYYAECRTMVVNFECEVRPLAAYPGLTDAAGIKARLQ